MLKEGENVGPLTLRITPLTFDQFFTEGNVLPDALQSQDLPDPAECKLMEPNTCTYRDIYPYQ